MAPGAAQSSLADPTSRKAELRALAARSDRRGLVQLAGHLLLLAASGAVVLGSLDSWALLAPPLLAHGIVLVFLFAPLHETIHRTAFRRRGLNDAVARVAGFLLLLPADYFRAFHLAHHRFTADRRRDPELAGPPLDSRAAYLWHVTGLPYWRERVAATCRHARGRVTEDFVPARLRPAIVAEARGHLAGYALLAAASLAGGSGLLLWLWVIPALLGQPFLRLYLLAEHSGCPEVPDMLANSRTTLTNRMVRALCWNMNLHSAHHAYPAVPFHALPTADRLLAPQIAERSPGYIAVQRETWKNLAPRGAV
ncbi:MAG: fatty acid desaturase [Kiloniellaceae bacterium]|nr:fatty acid desaturase [Kiloniellaceae bacterium]